MAVGTETGEQDEDQFSQQIRQIFGSTWEPADQLRQDLQERNKKYNSYIAKGIMPKGYFDDTEDPETAPTNTPYQQMKKAEEGMSNITETGVNPWHAENKLDRVGPDAEKSPQKISNLSREYSPDKVSYSHHVPLVASYREMPDGDMNLSIDSRLKGQVPEQYLPFLWDHEKDEKDMIPSFKAEGLSDAEAYRKAHDLSTGVESRKVLSALGPEGQEQYKKFFGDAATTTAEIPPGFDKHIVHPDDHTTQMKLNESELNINPETSNFADYATAGKKILDQFMGGFKALPNPEDPNYREKAIEFASGFAMGGTFGPGELAEKTLGKGIMAVAEQAEKMGTHADDIYKSTGLFRGLDGKWRFEIPDNEAIFTGEQFLKEHPEKWNKRGDKYTAVVRIDDILRNHPKLFENYPWLKDIDVIIDTGMKADRYGEMLPGQNIIKLNSSIIPHADQAKNTLMHEIQHLIQERYGFAQGTSPEYEETKRMLAGKYMGKKPPGQYYLENLGELESSTVGQRSISNSGRTPMEDLQARKDLIEGKYERLKKYIDPKLVEQMELEFQQYAKETRGRYASGPGHNNPPHKGMDTLNQRREEANELLERRDNMREMLQEFDPNRDRYNPAYRLVRDAHERINNQIRDWLSDYSGDQQGGRLKER